MLIEKFGNFTASGRVPASAIQQRMVTILELPLDSIGNEQIVDMRFQEDEAEALGPPESERTSPRGSPMPTKQLRPQSGASSYVASLYTVPLLTREKEAFLFRKMNYLKYTAGCLRDSFAVKRPTSRLMDQIENLYGRAVETRNQIIRANLRLVVSIAKRYARSGDDFFELVSNGNLSLFRAVEKFDISRGNRFSTYATWAIFRTFARSIPAALRQRCRFRSVDPETLGMIEDDHIDESEQNAAQLLRESLIQEMLKQLDERERRIITSRFALDHRPAGGQTLQKPLTLQQVGATLGITKERVRQIQARTIDKMREAADASDRLLT